MKLSKTSAIYQASVRFVPDLLGVGGLVLVTIGVWLISPAWALIVLGLGVIGWALLLAKPEGD